ncbi:MAG: protein kinase domain-containing protein [Luteimonas sp.]
MSQAPSNEGGKTTLPEIKGYRLLRVLGTGGMSTVYLGDQISLSRQVAIKVMLPEALADEVSRRRFENEARTIARLEHPHIVGIYEVGRSRDGLPYYSMPHLSRGHLGQRIVDGDGKLMDPMRVREILRALLSALGYAHARGTIHRDVKAENVLFDEAERPLLADFGIALRRGFGTRVTTAGLAVGSTAYMAPEQARGEEVDHRTDLYAVGVLAWEMLNGELPYNAGDAVSMAVMHVKDPIPRLPSHLRHWQRFIDHALAKTPGKRYRDTAHMLEALDRVSQRSVTREMLAVPALRQRAAKLRHMPMVAWLGMVLVIAAGTGVYLRNRSGEPSFYRVPQTSASTTTSADDARSSLPAPYAQPGQSIVSDPSDALLRAAPASEAERWVALAGRQIRERHLTSPKLDNAFDSLLAAQKSDATYLGLAAATDTLIGALADDSVRLINAGNDAPAREQIKSAQRLSERMPAGNDKAMTELRKDVAQALMARLDSAAAAFDHASAVRTMAGAKSFGLSRADLARLGARARGIPQAGETLEAIAGDMLLVRNGDTMFAAARQPVSRDEYARFATATGRKEALCRERGSLLRIVSPRSWKSPGFAQSANQPVVCVSWSDAEAYARWLSQRDGRHYRLPQAREAGFLPSRNSGKRIAEWNNDCSGDCSKRISSGVSWRLASGGARALDAERGYDDIGIRLVSDLPHAVTKR